MLDFWMKEIVQIITRRQLDLVGCDAFFFQPGLYLPCALISCFIRIKANIDGVDFL